MSAKDEIRRSLQSIIRNYSTGIDNKCHAEHAISLLDQIDDRQEDKKLEITDEMLFHSHAATPVCPFCGRQSKNGPMGHYQLYVTCWQCGGNYTVTRTKDDQMQYEWEFRVEPMRTFTIHS
jgi:hypothetical protein